MKRARVCHSPWNEKRKKARLVVAMAYLHRLAVGKSRSPMALGRKARSVAARLATSKERQNGKVSFVVVFPCPQICYFSSTTHLKRARNGIVRSRSRKTTSREHQTLATLSSNSPLANGKSRCKTVAKVRLRVGSEEGNIMIMSGNGQPAALRHSSHLGQPAPGS